MNKIISFCDAIFIDIKVLCMVKRQPICKDDLIAHILVVTNLMPSSHLTLANNQRLP